MKNIKKRVLSACCGAHILHDGYTDLLYVLFPVWQVAFGLSLAEVGSLKTLYSGAMASLQVPSIILSERVGDKIGVNNTIGLIAGMVLLVLPLTLGLQQAFRKLAI